MVMADFVQMRRNMVASQLQTNGIGAPEILAAFESVPREIFLPENIRGVSYVDEDIPLPGGGFMPEPMVLAKMLAALRAPGAETALCVGDATGYAAALLARLVNAVVALETKPRQFDTVRETWLSQGIHNIAVAKGNARRGCPEHAPYELVLICGAVDYIPDDLLRQLAPGGRLCAVVRTQGRGSGHIALAEKGPDGICHGAQRLSDAAMPFAEGFGAESRFSF